MPHQRRQVVEDDGHADVVDRAVGRHPDRAVRDARAAEQPQVTGAGQLGGGAQADRGPGHRSSVGGCGGGRSSVWRAWRVSTATGVIIAPQGTPAPRLHPGRDPRPAARPAGRAGRPGLSPRGGPAAQPTASSTADAWGAGTAARPPLGSSRLPTARPAATTAWMARTTTSACSGPSRSADARLTNSVPSSRDAHGERRLLGRGEHAAAGARDLRRHLGEHHTVERAHDQPLPDAHDGQARHQVGHRDVRPPGQQRGDQHEQADELDETRRPRSPAGRSGPPAASSRATRAGTSAPSAPCRRPARSGPKPR